MAKKSPLKGKGAFDEKAKSNLPAKITATNVPDYIRKQEVEGLDTVKKYQNVPILTIVHATSKADRQDNFGIGSIIAGDVMIAEFNQPFTAVPLFFWPSWQKRRDYNDKTPGNFIIEESYNLNSELAVACRNPETREEDYPGNPKLKYTRCECFNFALMLGDDCGEMSGQIAVLKYAIGSHKIGRRLCSYLSRRGVAIYLNRLELQCVKVPGNAQEFYAVEFNQPEENEWVSEDEIPNYRELHLSMKRVFDHGDLEMGKEAPSPDAEE